MPLLSSDSEPAVGEQWKATCLMGEIIRGMKTWPSEPAVAVGDGLTAVESLARTEPVMVGVIALAVAGAATLVALLLWRRRRAPGQQLRHLLAAHDGVAIVMHPDPDPDAMGSAVGVAHLAATVDTEADIYYSGEIRRHENRAFRTVLDLAFERVEAARELYGETVILVDHNEPRGFDGAAAVDPVAVIDHHPGDGEGKEFTDVRPEYGACSSIVAEYLRSVGVTPPGDDGADGEYTLPTEVASALLYGIQTDTTYLSRGCTDADFDCCSFLYPAIDGDVLDRIANPPVDSETLDVQARAIRGRLVRMPFVVSDVGEVSNVDTIAQAAEELLRLEGVTAVAVFGEKDGVYHVSGRSRDDRVHMGHALELAVDELVDGAAGGHARMGGGQVPVGAIGSGAGRANLADRLFTAMNGEEA